MQEHEVFAAVGDEGFQRLVAAFYQQVPDDDILGPMYPAEDLVGAEERLRGFLIYRFGGPQTYIEQRGNPMLRARHAPFHVNEAARDRWVQLMDNAFASADLPEAAVSVMKPFLANVATFLINQQS